MALLAILGIQQGVGSGVWRDLKKGDFGASKRGVFRGHFGVVLGPYFDPFLEGISGPARMPHLVRAQTRGLTNMPNTGILGSREVPKKGHFGPQIWPF